MSQAPPETRCPHMASCEMYDLFTLAGTVDIWKHNYCTSKYDECARYRLSSAGRAVPVNLMPNGNYLKRA